MDSRYAVVDASAGVKWFSPEPGHEDALDLLRRAARGDVVLVVPDLFIYEVLRTVRRKAGAEMARGAVVFFSDAGLVAVPPSAGLLEATLGYADETGCDVYDACSAALATMLDAPLYSADRRAHGRHPSVVLIG
ncbi:MAG: type II toxin-antitoxin system VapC family toxin [Coriobacteriia bacterium]|nr:type II toxin-antitoxin system VapC family toxin [Coriobacteriia bacterium]